jgi:hypothetical protein
VNDRLLLGMKGTFSELELSILRQRAHEALQLKAKRGDLHTCVAVGYIRSADDRLELDPDRRVREVLNLVFRKFDEIGSVRQVALWLHDERIRLPVIAYGPQGRTIEWHLPRYNTVHRLLTNPVYAGAYVFGRTGSSIRVEDGRKVIRRGIPRRQDEWEVLIRDHHAGYITWEQYERNQRLIGENATLKGAMVAGSVRHGGGILAGLLRCGHCGRKLKVRHNGLRGVARYVCTEASTNHGARCTATITMDTYCLIQRCSRVASHSSEQRSRPARRREPGVRQGTRRFKLPYATTTSIPLVSPDSVFRRQLNSIEPPRYVTRMPGGVGGAAPRSVRLGRSAACYRATRTTLLPFLRE